MIDGRIVRRLLISLRRWRCPNCRSSFADCPTFLVAHKHYALPELHLRAKSYVEREGVTYRRGVEEAGLPVFHDEVFDLAASTGSDEASEIAAVLSHSTLYRWVTTFGAVGRAPTTGRRGNVSPLKYRSEARKRALGSCRALFGQPWFMIARLRTRLHRVRNKSYERGC